MLAAAFALTALGTPRARLDKLASDYGIEVAVIDRATKVDRDGYTVSAKAVPEGTLALYALLFEREWRRYPPSLMAKAHMKRIVLGADVRVLDQPRAAVPEFGPGWFWLDAPIGVRNVGYGRHALHHDFFHILDEWDSADHRRDKSWEALNASGAKYGNGGWFMQKGNPGALRADLPGFLNEYSTSAVEEDKAEVYSCLLTDAPFVADRVAADPVIAAKVKRLKELVASFEPEMNEAWFRKNAVEPR